MKYYCRVIFFFSTILLGAVANAQLPWVLIDSKADRLTVMGADGPVKIFDNIAVGVRGAGRKVRRGDETTPLGSFRITHINPASRFYLFFQLDYPNLEYATIALAEKRINQHTYQRIVNAVQTGRPPPQDTALGGYIGIHGIGRGNPNIHETFNWTNGCIALTNQQVQELASWVKVGTRVEIR